MLEYFFHARFETYGIESLKDISMITIHMMKIFRTNKNYLNIRKKK